MIIKLFRFITVIIPILSTPVKAQMISSMCQKEVVKLYIFTLDNSIYSPVGFNRINFFSEWMDEGALGHVYDDTKQIDAILSEISQWEVRDTLDYNVYDVGPMKTITLKNESKVFLYEPPEIVGAIVLSDTNNNVELMWITSAGVERGNMRYKIPDELYRWLYSLKNRGYYTSSKDYAEQYHRLCRLLKKWRILGNNTFCIEL